MEQSRTLHYLLITLVWASVCLPGLGQPSLWDIDEGNNAEAAREMLLSENWIVPQFNYALRTDKPPLLYWLQITGYNHFGVNEFAARLPSALATWLLALLVCELGRVLFGPVVGLLAGVGTPTCLLLCASAHFANPDALLTLCLTGAFASFWAWYRGIAWAVLPLGISLGLGILAKGPVALVLPTLIWAVFMLWQGRYLQLWRPGFLMTFVVAALVALPWYIWVTVETRGHWIAGFWFRHNQGRFLTTMESHGGPIIYYLPVLLIGLAPWSLFLIHAVADAVSRSRKTADPLPPTAEAVRRRDVVRYLLVWAGVYVLFFSLSATKLPNYVLPVYPALMLLIADRLERWRRGESLPTWVMPAALGALLVTALALALIAPLAGQEYPGLQWLGLLALIPLLTLVVFAVQLRRGNRTGFVVAMAALATLTTSVMAMIPAATLEPHKAVKALVAELPSDHLQRDVRILTLDYFQPSLVFYTRRFVEPMATLEEIEELLQCPQPTYALMPRSRWEELQTRQPTLAREVASRRDLYRRKEIVLLTNEHSEATATANLRAPQGEP